jgi:hypothetical protein
MALHLPMAILTIHLTAAPELPQKTLRAAEEQAAHILSSAQVKVVWRERGDLQLQIVNTEARGLAGDAAGFAVLIPGGAGYAAVSWPTVEREARQMEVDAAYLLGAAIAHEVGHLLFGPSHAAAGVMAARLGQREMRLAAQGELRFEGPYISTRLAR